MRRIAVVALVGAVAVGWYLFRPDRLFVSRTVDEAAPGSVVRTLVEGTFEARAHDGRGRAAVLELADGSRVLRLSEFETLDGPDVFVYLIGAPDVASEADLDAAGYVNLGPLKGNIGSQNYVVPADIDVTRMKGVSVWCRRFAVNFTTAALQPVER